MLLNRACIRTASYCHFCYFFHSLSLLVHYAEHLILIYNLCTHICEKLSTNFLGVTFFLRIVCGVGNYVFIWNHRYCMQISLHYKIRVTIEHNGNYESTELAVDFGEVCSLWH